MIERRNGGIVVVCGQCGNEHDTGMTDFAPAMAEFEARGGKVKFNGNSRSWSHFCNNCRNSPEAFRG